MIFIAGYKDHSDSVANWADRAGVRGVVGFKLELTPGELVCPVTGLDCDRAYCESFCHSRGCKNLSSCKAYNNPHLRGDVE